MYYFRYTNNIEFIVNRDSQLAIGDARNTMGYNIAIQGFRGFAALSVLVFHLFSANVLSVRGPVQLWATITDVAFSLQFGVELFFMISGFVITGSLRRHRSTYLFLLDRIVRIYPAFLPIHLLIFAIGPFLISSTVGQSFNGWQFFRGITPSDYAVDFVANLAFLPGVFPFPLAHWAAWSLSYEWVFYVVGVTAHSIINSRACWMRRIVTVLLCGGIVVFLNFYPRAIFFIPGWMAAMNEESIKRLSRILRWPSVFLIGFFLFWKLTGVLATEQPSLQVWYWLFDQRLVAAALAFLCGLYVISALVGGQGVFVTVMRTSTFQFLGKISYSLYLWHPIIIVATKHTVQPLVSRTWGREASDLVFVIIAIGASVFTGWLSWRLFEQSVGLAIRNWIRKRQPAR